MALISQAAAAEVGLTAHQAVVFDTVRHARLVDVDPSAGLSGIIDEADATPHEAAIRISLHCPGHDRLQYLIADGHSSLLVAGRPLPPFVPWQLATADWSWLRASLSPPPAATTAPLLPAESIVPAQVSEERFATRCSEVQVHRLFRPLCGVLVDPNLGPTNFGQISRVPCGSAFLQLCLRLAHASST